MKPQYINPGPGQESVWESPHPPRVEDFGETDYPITESIRDMFMKKGSKIVPVIKCVFVISGQFLRQFDRHPHRMITVVVPKGPASA